MNLEELKLMQEPRQPWSALTGEQKKIMMDQAGDITGKALKKIAIPPLMIVGQSSKLAKRGIETWAKKAKAKGMTETAIWEASFDKFGQGAYYDDLDNMWKIQVPTPNVRLNKKTSYVVDGPKTTQRTWENQKLENILNWPDLKKEKLGRSRVPMVEAGRGVEEYGAYDVGKKRIHTARGPTQKSALKVLMHEAQHGFQDEVGMTGGDSPSRHEMTDDYFQDSKANHGIALSGRAWLEFKADNEIADGEETEEDWSLFTYDFEEQTGMFPEDFARGARRKDYNTFASAEKRIADELKRSRDPVKAYYTKGGEGDARYTMNTHLWDADTHRENFIKDKYEENTGPAPYNMKWEDRYRQLTHDEYEGNEEVWESVGKKKPNKKVGVSGLAPGLIGEKWKPPQSDIFDMTGLDDPSRFIDTPQVAPERYRPARGVPKDIMPAGHKKNMDRVAGLLEDGIQKGGLSWYNLRPLRDEYLNIWGEEEGSQRFKNFAEIFAAGSPRSKVIMNNKRTSMFQKLKQDGVDISKVLNAGKTPTPQQFNEGYTVMPQGYGDFAHGLHVPIIGDVESGVGLTGGKQFGRPKVSTFGQNLQGNLAGSTVDTHNKKAWTLPLGLKQEVKDNEYGFLDDLNKKQAARHGIQPAQAQSSIWQGASEITGVDDSRPLMQIIDERVRKTADKMNISPQDMRDGLIKGKLPLLSLFGAEKILNQFRPRPLQDQALRGGGLNMLRRGSGS